MLQWQYLLLMALAAGFVLLIIWNAIRKRRFRKARDFTRRLETLLLPKEEVKTICPGKHGHWVLTNKRLILEEGEGFTAFPFSKIKKLSGADETGKATVAAGKMAVLTIKAGDREFALSRKDDSFTELVKTLKTKVAGEKRKAAAKKKPKA